MWCGVVWGGEGGHKGAYQQRPLLVAHLPLLLPSTLPPKVPTLTGSCRVLIRLVPSVAGTLRAPSSAIHSWFSWERYTGVNGPAGGGERYTGVNGPADGGEGAVHG